MYMYVSEICAEGIFVTFPLWLENVKSRSKTALFSKEHHFEIWFPNKRTIVFFWIKLSKLHKKDPILHVATTFSLKQGKTRTSHGPIPHPLTFTIWKVLNKFDFWILKTVLLLSPFSVTKLSILLCIKWYLDIFGECSSEMLAMTLLSNLVIFTNKISPFSAYRIYLGNVALSVGSIQ